MRRCKIADASRSKFSTAFGPSMYSGCFITLKSNAKMPRKRPLLYGPDDRPIPPSELTSKEQDKTRKTQPRKPPRREQSKEQRTSLLLFLWSKLPVWLRGALVFATLLITLQQGYPWLSVEKDELLDIRNPYSALFYVVNDGYWPVSDLDAECVPTFALSSNLLLNNSFNFIRFTDYLLHSGRASIPCFRVISNDPSFKAFLHSSDQSINPGNLTITISYSFYPFSWRKLRRHQSFYFHPIRDAKGGVQWLYGR